MKKIINTNRRSFILKSFLASMGLYLKGNSSHARAPIQNKNSVLKNMDQLDPIAKLNSQVFPSIDFNGEEIDRPHKILWDLENYIKSKGGLPQNFERANVVVVGGGISGLVGAYYLKDFSPIILEGATQLGGNSKGEKWKENLFSIGAAYICTPEENSSIDLLLRDIGLTSEDFKSESDENLSIVLKKTLHRGFWNGASDTQNAADFNQVYSKLKEIYENAYPDMPYVLDGEMTREDFDKLDKINFEEWLKTNMSPLHPHIEEFFSLYCWSSFGCEMEEISAAQALNFITAEVGGVQALLGGNSVIAQKLYEKLKNLLPADTFRVGHFVLDIKYHEEGVDIVYEDHLGQLKMIRAKACLVTTPKKVAKRIIPQLPSAQKEAMNKIQYHAYLVANVVLKNKISPPAYDIFKLKGKKPYSAFREGDERFATDVIFADWASTHSLEEGETNKVENKEKTVLTFYIPRAYQGAEHFLFSKDAHDKYRDLLKTKLPEWFEAFGIDMNEIDGIRMTRWGHAMPVAKTGLIASGLAELASQTLNNQIYFANQDNWANPCFETAFECAKQAAEQIENYLKS